MEALTRPQWLGRAVARAVEGVATLFGVGPRSPRRRLLDRLSKKSDERLFPEAPPRHEWEDDEAGWRP